MKNELSTKLVYLDLKTILANYKKPSFWKKEWVIFKSSKVEITWRLVSIDCRGNKIQSEVVVKPFVIIRGGKKIYLYGDDYHNTFNCQMIPIANDEYNDTIFQNNILGTCLYAIQYIEQHRLVPQYNEYKEAMRMESDEEDNLREIASDFLDQQNVSHEAIRDAYIDKYLDDHSSQINQFTSRVINNFQYKILPNIYLMLCSWFNNQEKFDEYSKLCKGVRKSIRLEIWKKSREIQTDDWKESMQADLEDI